MWAGYDSYLTAARDILGLRLPEYEKYTAWEQCAIEGGFRIMHDEFCMVSDFPEHILIDAQNRPHCDDGPSHRWRDGWSLYHVHGVRVPDWLIESPQELSATKIDAETNAEVRRVMLDRFGAERYMRETDAKVVAQLGHDHPMIGLRDARLILRDIPDDEPIVMVDCVNSSPEPDGSYRRYMLRVQPDAYNGAASTDVMAAMASTWRNADGSLLFKRPQDYRPEVET